MSDLLVQLSVSRRWQQQSYAIPVVVAIICRENAKTPSFLLIKRIHQPYASKWALIGGKWDFGETLSQAVTREVREETGLITDFGALREVVNERIFPHQSPGFGAQFSIFVCEVQAHQGEPQEQQEGAVAWFTEEQLNALWMSRDIVPTDYLILKHYLTATQSFSYIEAEIIADIMDGTMNEIRRFEKMS